ncbi:hypothetical protein KAH94_03630 [bacterium]|nr:hypothetical protein [bacterium]
MNKNELYPIYELWHVPFWQTKAFYIGLGVLLAILISLFVWYGIKRYRLLKKPVKPSWEFALEELEDIKKKLLSGSILGKTFYFRLTWIFKQYFYARYNFNVFGKTDNEIWFYLEGSGLSQDLLESLKLIFEGSSVVKFANKEVAQERMQKDLQASIVFINKTAIKNKK